MVPKDIKNSNQYHKHDTPLTELIYQIKAPRFKEWPCNNKESETMHQILICQARKIDAKENLSKKSRK